MAHSARIRPVTLKMSTTFHPLSAQPRGHLE
jgi:hypothetical protein